MAPGNILTCMGCLVYAHPTLSSCTLVFDSYKIITRIFSPAKQFLNDVSGSHLRGHYIAVIQLEGWVLTVYYSVLMA
jgi:hypothetical protein